MGHQIDYHTFPYEMDKKEIMAELYEFGSCNQPNFAGFPNQLRWLDKGCSCEEDAYECIDQNDKGWYDQIAVSFLDASPGAEENKLRQRLDSVYSSIRKIESKVHYADAAAEFIGCKGCGSKLSRKHIRSNQCPLCYSDLRPASTLQKLQKLKDKSEDLEARILALRKKNTKGKRKWLVKTEFHI